MSIRKKAAVETAKLTTFFALGGVTYYYILDLLGPKLGLGLLLVSLVGYFVWLAYDFYVHKFTVEEKFKL